MEKHQIIPDVIPQGPVDIADILYSNDVKVDQGNELTPTQVKDIPKVNFKCEEGVYYTLCMTDPDAPSRKDPKFREWHHWLVVNIPGSDIEQGETLSEYIGSAPPKDSGLHRYVFLIYKQDCKKEFNEKCLTNRSGEDRAKFSIKKFAEKYNLGEPIAGNFYQAQWDDYVPTVYKQLEGH